MPMVRNFNLLVQYAFNQFPSCVNIFYQKKMLDVEQIFEANVGPLESEVNWSLNTSFFFKVFIFDMTLSRSFPRKYHFS